MTKLNEFTFKDKDSEYLEYLEFVKDVKKVKNARLFKYYLKGVTFETWKESKDYFNDQLRQEGIIR